MKFVESGSDFPVGSLDSPRNQGLYQTLTWVYARFISQAKGSVFYGLTPTTVTKSSFISEWLTFLRESSTSTSHRSVRAMKQIIHVY